MSIQFHEEKGGRVLTVHVSGKLLKADYEQFVPEFEHLIRQHGKLRLLFEMESDGPRYFDHTDAAEARQWLEEA